MYKTCTCTAVQPDALVKEEGAVPPMPSDAFLKTEAVVKEEVERSGSRPKRQRAK